MQRKKLYEDFEKKEWNYLMIEGSFLGNSSFLLSFIKDVLFGEEEKEFRFINNLLGEEKSILYLRTEEFPKGDTTSPKIIEDLNKISIFESVFNEEAFEYRNIIRMLQNRRYTHLILDDVRKKYEDNDKRFLKFSEILTLCEQFNIKVMTSVTENSLKKVDYLYNRTDLILRISHNIIQNLYLIEVEDKKMLSLKKYSLSMK